MRVMMPGSMAQWADTFAKNVQLGGSSISMSYNALRQRAVDTIYDTRETGDKDFRISLDWLKAFGVGAVAVSGKRSQEYWKPFTHPDKFTGRLPVLWEEDDVAIYRVSPRDYSLAHVVEKSSLVSDSRGKLPPVSSIEPYVNQLDDPSIPKADLQWDGRNRIRIHAVTEPGQVISIQVSYHPGWRALVNGNAAKLHTDGLGLIWIEPGVGGPTDVDLTYAGGVELWVCRILNLTALVLLVVFFPVSFFLRRSRPNVGRT
jgi:hypothetical protein